MPLYVDDKVVTKAMIKQHFPCPKCGSAEGDACERGPRDRFSSASLHTERWRLAEMNFAAQGHMVDLASGGESVYGIEPDAPEVLFEFAMQDDRK